MKNQKNIKNSVLKGTFAVLVGFVNGFFGGGGGLLCVPTLEKVYKLETKNAHATAVAIMFPLSFASSIIYLISNSINTFSCLAVAIGSSLGGLVGAFALKKFNSNFIRWIFIAILFTAGVRMVI